MRGENDSKCFEVSLQAFHLATSNDGEHIWRLLHDVRNRDRDDVLRTDFFGDLLKCGTNDLSFSSRFHSGLKAVRPFSPD